MEKKEEVRRGCYEGKTTGKKRVQCDEGFSLTESLRYSVYSREVMYIHPSLLGSVTDGSFLLKIFRIDGFLLLILGGGL